MEVAICQHEKVTPCHYKKLVIPHTIFSTKVLVSIENRDILVKKICPDFVYYDYLMCLILSPRW